MEGQGVRGQEVPQYSKDIPYSRDLGVRSRHRRPCGKEALSLPLRKKEASQGQVERCLDLLRSIQQQPRDPPICSGSRGSFQESTSRKNVITPHSERTLSPLSRPVFLTRRDRTRSG